MVALQDREGPKAFAGSAKANKNRKGLAVLPPEEVWGDSQLPEVLHRLQVCTVKAEHCLVHRV